MASTMKMRDGKISIDRIEINVVHHCNLTCRACSHLSSALPPHFASPDKIYDDLSILSAFCRPERISLLGGEPLLHPDLPEIIYTVRKSGISGRIRVVTNGTLLHHMPEQFWASVDEVYLSLYPWHTIKAKQLAALKACARRNSTALVLRYQTHFREIYLEHCNMDDSLVRRIYHACKVAHEDSCHVLEDGYFYKCPQAVFIPLVYRDRADLTGAGDAVDIRSSHKAAEMLAGYLAAETPLAACRYCLGSAGKRFVPSQESCRSRQQQSRIEELIDWKHLEKLEKRKRFLSPALSQSIRQNANGMISRLPASILLSTTLQRSMSALSNFRHQYFASW